MQTFLSIPTPTTVVICPFHVELKNRNDEQDLSITDDEFTISFNHKEITCEGFFNVLTLEEVKNIDLDEGQTIYDKFSMFGEQTVIIIENYVGDFIVEAIDDDNENIEFQLKEFFYNDIDEDVRIQISTSQKFEMKEVSFDVFSQLSGVSLEGYESFEDYNKKDSLEVINDEPKTLVFLPFFVESKTNDEFQYIIVNPFEKSSWFTLATPKQCTKIEFKDSDIFSEIDKCCENVTIFYNVIGKIYFDSNFENFISKHPFEMGVLDFFEFGRLLDQNK